MVTQLSYAVVVGNSLAISYTNGHEDYIPLEKVRKLCPCAFCQGEPDILGRVLLKNITYCSDSFELIKIVIIGGYALQLFWRDSHSTGIYAYDYLKKITHASYN